MEPEKKQFGLGIDIGATKIAGAIVDASGRTYEKIWHDTKNKSSEDLLKQIDEIIEVLKQKFDGEDWWESIPIGIGFAGTINFNDQKIIFAPNIPILKEINLTDLSNKYKEHSLFYDNDAQCALISEMLAGVGKTEKNIILITLGTGIGGAIAINGRLYRGSNGGGGELGQMMADWQMYGTTSGAKGTIEQILGGRYLQQLYGKSAKDLFNMVKEGQTHPFFDRWTSALTAFLKSLNFIFEPNVFIVAGSISQSADLFLPALNSKIETPVKVAKFIENAGVIGAGLLAISGNQQNTAEKKN